MTKLISSGWVVQPSVIWMLMVVVNRQIYGGFDSCVISVWLLGKQIKREEQKRKLSHNNCVIIVLLDCCVVGNCVQQLRKCFKNTKANKRN